MPPAKDGNTGSRQQVSQVVDDLNSLVQDLKRDLQFSVDAESGETIIRVVDSESQKTIRTIPPSEINVVSQRLMQTNGGLLFSASV
jgi:flagellar protein FlaG